MAYETLAKKFKPGDLIYGNGEEVALAETAVKNAKSYTSYFGLDKTCILIQNTITDSTVDVKGMTNVYNPLPAFIPKDSIPDKLDSNSNQLTKSKSDVKRTEKYQEHIAQHERWDPELKGGKEGEPFVGTVSEQRLKIWKRTSKGGLEFQTIVRQRKIHFLVGNMNMNHVVNKTGGARGGESVTSTELRWLFRNWNNSRVRNNVIFWDHNGKIRAPWESAPQTWAGYKEHVDEKHHARDMAKLMADSEVVVFLKRPDEDDEDII